MNYFVKDFQRLDNLWVVLKIKTSKSLGTWGDPGFKLVLGGELSATVKLG